MWGAYFCMGAYKRDVVVTIKMGACIHGVLILCGCLLSRFCGVTVICVSPGNVCHQTHFPSDIRSPQTDIIGLFGNISVSDICFPGLTVLP